MKHTMILNRIFFTKYLLVDCVGCSMIRFLYFVVCPILILRNFIQWCIPKPGAEFVARMEDVLDVYQRPYDPLRPVVCLDETNRQLIEKRRIPSK